MSLKCPDEVLDFPNHERIEINYSRSVSYLKVKKYDPKIMNQGFIWHQIIIMHHGKLRGVEGKRMILEAIFEAVEGEELYPVAYRCGHHEDRFLVRQCQPAMDKLFAQNLRLQLLNGASVGLEIKLNVAEFKYGHISPVNEMTKRLNILLNKMDSWEGEERGILNLSRFAQYPEFRDIVINLGNRSTLERLCALIYNDVDRYRKINGMVFSENGITTLAPFHVFKGEVFSVLDLRDNKIKSASRFCRDLEYIKADEIMLIGNPLTKSVDYPECLRSILKNFKKIDGIQSENLGKNYTPLDNNSENDSEGYHIDWSNKADVNKFEKSTDWHAVMIPDPKHDYNKDEIFNNFFLTISPDFTDVFPCYYKYSSGEHQFLVRKCFNQIKHLVENCNLEINIHRFVEPPPPGEDTTDYAPQLVVDKTLIYYMRMNISPFTKGQLEPLECIDKALSRRYNGMDRLLNLSDFQNIEGLENIVINLSSPNILKRVLMQASRKFHTNCVELRLASNKIVSANFQKVLTLMGNLKAIDLGNNWIPDLEAIQQLAYLGIKSLRLDGNPLCSNFIFAGEYIKTVKNYFPELMKLDGVEITVKGNLCSQKNFLCDLSGYDFVEEFIVRYFKTFQSDRHCLKDLYHRKACLTITCNFNIAKLTAQNSKRIKNYKNVSRNLHKLDDYSRAYASVHLGPDEIMSVLMNLPDAKFDMFSFTTDCTVNNENMIVITINGVFLDTASVLETDILMGFSRTFILVPTKRNAGSLKCATAYYIVNDQFNIFNSTASQDKLAFTNFSNEPKSSVPNLSVNEKEAILVLFQEAAGLKSIWCTRCLEEANWDFEKALEVFLELCNRDEVPNTAFV